MPHHATRRDNDGQQGFTLVELLVVVTILTIIGGIVGGTIIQSMQTGRRAEARIQSLNDLERTLQRVGRELRSGGCSERLCGVELPPIDVDPNHNFDAGITTNVYRDGQLHVFTYHWSETPGDDLLQDIQVYDVSDLTNPIRDVQNDVVIADVADFELTYYDASFEDGDLDGADDPLHCTDLDLSDPADSATCIGRFENTTLRLGIRVVKQLAEQDDQVAQTHVTIRNAR